MLSSFVLSRMHELQKVVITPRPYMKRPYVSELTGHHTPSWRSQLADWERFA
jgi:hypothetical protein